MKKPLSWPIIGTASLTVVLVFMISALLFLTKNTTPLSTAFNESSNEGLGGEDAVKEDKLEEILPVYREVTLMPGQTQQIQLYTYPQNADLSQLEWESSQENIKISSAGYVNSRFPGSEGIVKVRDKNGSLETQCKVRVMSEEEAFYNTINLINTGNLEDNMLINFTEDNFKPGDKQLHSRTDEAIAIFDLVNRELATYSVIQKQLINAQTNNNIDCDVYMERETGDIRKIVTIEHLADTLEITDYYFKDGKVYFIFQRHENYYRPVAAQQDFPGERCYIVDDAIVRWREIHKNSNDMFEKTDYYHVKEGFSWVTKEYKDLSNVDTEKKDYVKPRDDEEYRKEKELDFANRQKDMINSAYNLYNKVLQTPSITELTGYVLDQSGNPMEGAHLKVFSDDYSVLVAETITKPDGAYTLKVPMHTKSYRIDISKAGYVSTTIYDVDTSIDAVSSFQENIYMYREGQGEYTIRLNLIDALHGENINDAKVIIRSGINNKKGTIVKQFNLSDYYPDYMYDDYLYDDEYLYDDYMYEPFYYDVRLYPGNYTAEIQSPGYTSTYFTLSTFSDGWVYHSSVVPKVKGDEVRIVLSWGNTPPDLDSHLFFPDEQHIAYYNREVGNSLLDRDDVDGYGPETITIDSLQKGIYKYYVCDFTNSAYGNYNSTQMSNSFAKVDVYNKNGLVRSFNVPTNKEGVIWHVFNISDGNIVPVQRYYNNLEDKKWWNSQKY